LEPDYLVSGTADSTPVLGDGILGGGRSRSGTRKDDAISRNDASGLTIIWAGEVPAEPKTTVGRHAGLAMKRGVDIAASFLALILLGPLLALTALAIKLTTGGPVIFRQTRVGHLGKPFTIYKFRSMYADQCDLPGSIQAMPGDDRVTAVGRFIRKTSIDELPQLFNVLRGDMSLVGPRPYVADMLAGGKPYAEIAPYFGMRNSIKPGLTGWAQANGLRGPTTSRDSSLRRVHHDIAYVQNFSLMLDARILVVTVWRELTGGSGV
jgi:polysaccharide biosynthesis protein PslA